MRPITAVFLPMKPAYTNPYGECESETIREDGKLKIVVKCKEKVLGEETREIELYENGNVKVSNSKGLFKSYKSKAEIAIEVEGTFGFRSTKRVPLVSEIIYYNGIEPLSRIPYILKYGERRDGYSTTTYYLFFDVLNDTTFKISKSSLREHYLLYLFIHENNILYRYGHIKSNLYNNRCLSQGYNECLLSVPLIYYPIEIYYGSGETTISKMYVVAPAIEVTLSGTKIRPVPGYERPFERVLELTGEIPDIRRPLFTKISNDMIIIEAVPPDEMLDDTFDVMVPLTRFFLDWK